MSSTIQQVHVGSPVTNRLHMRYFGGYWWLKMRDARLTFVFRPTESTTMRSAHMSVYAK